MRHFGASDSMSLLQGRHDYLAPKWLFFTHKIYIEIQLLLSKLVLKNNFPSTSLKSGHKYILVIKLV